MNKLYVTNGTGTARYWYIGEVECEFCKKNIPIGNIAFHIRMWKRVGGENIDFLICPFCTEKTPDISMLAPIHERRQVFISEVVPPKSLVVLPKRPDMIDANISVFDAARSNKGIQSDTSMCVTKDLTRYAGRPGYTFGEGPTMIGADVRGLLEQKDFVPSTNDGISYLDDLSKMSPVLPGNDKKRLEDKH